MALLEIALFLFMISSNSASLRGVLAASISLQAIKLVFKRLRKTPAAIIAVLTIQVCNFKQSDKQKRKQDLGLVLVFVKDHVTV